MQQPTRWLVDGLNVIGSTPDGWWRDRAAAKARLVAALDAWAAATGVALTVVIDGAAISHARPSVVEVRFAPGGPDAADDAIVSWLEDHPDEVVRVVTSDIALAARVRALGAGVEPARRFSARLQAPG